MAILDAAGIQSPGYALTRSWQQIFGGRTAASRPALSLSTTFITHNKRSGFLLRPE